jgi:hypothetical protein
MKKMKDIVIPKENAVFWMDGNGRWHNVHGLFRHKKLIDHFNRCLGWDADGFFVSQERGDIREKVYFRYEETALFAVGVVIGAEVSILLNTGEKTKIEPEDLYIKNDQLFMQYRDIQVKFTDRCTMNLSEYIVEKEGTYYFEFKDKRVMIATVDQHSIT